MEVRSDDGQPNIAADAEDGAAEGSRSAPRCIPAFLLRRFDDEAMRLVAKRHPRLDVK